MEPVQVDRIPSVDLSTPIKTGDIRLLSFTRTVAYDLPRQQVLKLAPQIEQLMEEDADEFQIGVDRFSDETTGYLATWLHHHCSSPSGPSKIKVPTHHCADSAQLRATFTDPWDYDFLRSVLSPLNPDTHLVATTTNLPPPLSSRFQGYISLLNLASYLLIESLLAAMSCLLAQSVRVASCASENPAQLMLCWLGILDESDPQYATEESREELYLKSRELLAGLYLPAQEEEPEATE